MDYINLAIRLRDWNNGQFLVEVVDSPVGRMRYPEVVSFNSNIVPYLEKLENPHEKGQLDLDELVELGEMLGDMLFPPSVRRIVQKSLVYVHGRLLKGLRLLLEVDDPLLTNLPWEYVYMWEYSFVRQSLRDTDRKLRLLQEGLDVIKADHKETLDAIPEIKNAVLTNQEMNREDAIRAVKRNAALHGFLARDPRVSIVRHESFITVPSEIEDDEDPNLNVFVAMAEPTDLGDLDLEDEFNGIKDALKETFKEHYEMCETYASHGYSADAPPKPNSRLVLDPEPGELHLTPKKLKKICDEHNFQIFHFAGHGGFFPISRRLFGRFREF